MTKKCSFSQIKSSLKKGSVRNKNGNCRFLSYYGFETEKNNDTVPIPAKKMENRNMIVDTWRVPRAAHASSQNNNVRVISSSLILPPSIRYNEISPWGNELNQIIIFIPGSTMKTEIAKKECSYSEFYKKKKVLQSATF